MGQRPAGPLDPQVERVCRRVVGELLGTRPGEHVLVMADESTEKAKVEGLTLAAKAIGAIPTVVIQPDAGWTPDVYALTRPAAKAYVGSDVVIAATMSSSSSMYGRPAEARQLMAESEQIRLMGLNERSLEVMLEDKADYVEVRDWNAAIKRFYAKSSRIRITTRRGTDFVGSLRIADPSQWPGLSHDGFALTPGTIGCYPDGEVHFPPPPETMSGVLVVDGPIANMPGRDPEESITIEVESGRIVDIRGGSDAKRLLAFLTGLDQMYVSEIGLGTNPSLGRHSVFGVAKKGLGSVHIAYGGWWGFQPDIPYKIHGDMVIYDATVEVDGHVLVRDGKLHLPAV